MSEFFDYDPHTGLTYATEWDAQKEEIIVHSKQDVKPVLDHISKIRNSGENDKGIKNEFWKYATIPTSVELALKEKGINIYNKDHQKAMFREINQNYPYLKTTRLHHE